MFIPKLLITTKVVTILYVFVILYSASAAPDPLSLQLKSENPSQPGIKLNTASELIPSKLNVNFNNPSKEDKSNLLVEPENIATIDANQQISGNNEYHPLTQLLVSQASADEEKTGTNENIGPINILLNSSNNDLLISLVEISQNVPDSNTNGVSKPIVSNSPQHSLPTTYHSANIDNQDSSDAIRPLSATSHQPDSVIGISAEHVNIAFNGSQNTGSVPHQNVNGIQLNLQESINYAENINASKNPQANENTAATFTVDKPSADDTISNTIGYSEEDLDSLPPKRPLSTLALVSLQDTSAPVKPQISAKPSSTSSANQQEPILPSVTEIGINSVTQQGQSMSPLTPIGSFITTIFPPKGSDTAATTGIFTPFAHGSFTGSYPPLTAGTFGSSQGASIFVPGGFAEGNTEYSPVSGAYLPIWFSPDATSGAAIGFPTSFSQAMASGYPNAPFTLAGMPGYTISLGIPTSLYTVSSNGQGQTVSHSVVSATTGPQYANIGSETNQQTSSSFFQLPILPVSSAYHGAYLPPVQKPQWGFNPIWFPNKPEENKPAPQPILETAESANSSKPNIEPVPVSSVVQSQSNSTSKIENSNQDIVPPTPEVEKPTAKPIRPKPQRPNRPQYGIAKPTTGKQEISPAKNSSSLEDQSTTGQLTVTDSKPTPLSMWPMPKWPSFSQIYENLFGNRLIRHRAESAENGKRKECVDEAILNQTEFNANDSDDKRPLCRAQRSKDTSYCANLCNDNGFYTGTCMEDNSCICSFTDKTNIGLRMEYYYDRKLPNWNEYYPSYGNCSRCSCSTLCTDAGYHSGVCGNTCYCGKAWHNGADFEFNGDSNLENNN